MTRLPPRSARQRAPRLLALSLLAAAGAAGTSQAQSTPQTPSAPVSAAALREVLVRQASYWIDAGQPSRAEHAIGQLLQIDPSGPEVQALLRRIGARAPAPPPPAAPPPSFAVPGEADAEIDSLIDSGQMQAAEQRLRALAARDTAPAAPASSGTALPADQPLTLAAVAVNDDAQSAPLPPNPFRSGTAAPSATASAPEPSPSLDTGDQLATEIDRRIAETQEQMAPKLDVTPGVIYRSGTPGLSQLVQVTGETKASFSPGGTGTLSVAVTPTYLTAGKLGSNTYAESVFGSSLLGSIRPLGDQTATGAGLDVSYLYRWLKADLGSTPLGFQQENVLGGLELSPRLSEDATLHLLAERRAVTDSLLSYAGTSDPRTGIRWGGVMRDRGYLRLDLTKGLVDLYAGGGFSWLTGTNVANNQDYEFGSGVSFPIWRNGRGELRTGLDVAYFAFQKNLSEFSLGQGGYFSPQSYVAGVIPLRYQERGEKWSWSIAGHIGYQSYNQHASPVFPANPDLQNTLQADIAAGTSALRTAYYPGEAVSGFIGGGGVSFAYRITPNWSVGGQAALQYTNSWREATATLFSRYVFGGLSE